jgi:hypothetical protein
VVVRRGAAALKQDEQMFDNVRAMPMPLEMSSEEVERLRRSVAMLPPDSPVNLPRELVLGVLAQLLRLIGQRRAPD